MRKQSAPGRSHPLVDTNRHFILGDRFHAATNPHQSHLCRYHDLDLCLQANTLKTSIQESQNNRKNQKRLRSSTIQNFETHVTYNYLMDFYQNEEVVDRQRKIMEQRLSKGQHLSRDKFLRFTIVYQIQVLSLDFVFHSKRKWLVLSCEDVRRKQCDFTLRGKLMFRPLLCGCEKKTM